MGETPRFELPSMIVTSTSPPRFQTVRGQVIAFDDHAGWGTLRSDAGDEWFFHCTQIADGTRTIPLGAVVEAGVEPLGFGSWEAAGVRPVSRR